MIHGLPDKLKILRQKYGYSQRDVANRLEISPSIISGYETGERTPSIEILLALSYLYKCSTDYLLGKEQKNPNSKIDVSGLTHDQILAITRLVETIREK